MSKYQIHEGQATPFIIGLSGYRNMAVVKKTLPSMVVALDAGKVKIVNKESACIVISKNPIVFEEEPTVRSRQLQLNYGGAQCHALMLLGTKRHDSSAYLEVIDLDLMHHHTTEPKAGNLVDKFVQGISKKKVSTPLAGIFASSYQKQMAPEFIVGYVAYQMYTSAFAAETIDECVGWLIHSAFDVWSSEIDTSLGAIAYDITGYCACSTPPLTISEVFEITLMNYAASDRQLLTYAALTKLQEKYGNHTIDFALAVLDNLGLTEHGGSIPGWLSPLGRFFIEYFKPGQFEPLNSSDPIYQIPKF